MRFSLNWRFLIVVAVLIGGGLAALHFVHRAQLKNLPAAYLRQADAARDAQQADKELAFLQRYLLSRPDDLDAKERQVRLVAKAARGKQMQNAYLAIDDLLTRDPNRDDLRRFAIEYAIRMRALKEADGHIQFLLDKGKNSDAEALLNRGVIRELERKWEAADWYQEAYKAKPDLLAAYPRRAFVLRERLSKPDEADKTIGEMTEKNATNPTAHLLAAEYWRQGRNPDKARAAVAEARKLAPDDLNVMLSTAQEQRQAAAAARNEGKTADAEARFAEARAELDRAAKLHPKAVEVHLARAQVEAAARGPAEAVKALAAGLESLPNDPVLLAESAEYQIAAGDAKAATATLDRLEKLKVPAKRLALHRARVKMLKEDWTGAADDFLKVRTEAAADPAISRAASLFLGRCLAAADQPDRALDAFTRAVPDDITDPLWADAVIGQAEVYLSLGRTDDALRAFRKLAADRPGVWLLIARLEVEKAIQAKAAGTADWTAAKQAFRMAENAYKEKDNVELKLLDAQLRAADGKPAEARKIIDDLFATRPKEPAVWQAKAAAQLSTQGEGLTAALATLEKGRAELGDPVELRLVQVMLSANPNDPQAAAKLTALADGLDKYPPAGRLRLTRRLAEAAAAVNARDLAGKLWAQVLAAKPKDVTALQQRFDLARQANDETGMKQAVDAISKAVGDAGVATHATTASYLLWRAEQKKELTGLEVALVHLDALEKERPDWSYVPLTKAVVYDLMDRSDDALKQYERAKALGETQPAVLRRMIGLLARKGRFAEANALFEKLPPDVKTGPDMRRLPAELALGAGDSKKAVELATQAVPADAKDPADLLWLGRLLLNAGQPAAAEKPFRTLVGLKPESPDEWLLLVESLARSGRKADAEAALAEAKGKVKKDAAALVDALGNGVLGKADEAKAAFARARTEQPASAAVLAAEANYLTDTQQWATAREAWERVMNRPGATADEKQSANQMLAVCLAGDPDFATAQKAIGLLKNSPDDRRARITVLSIQRDRASKLEAIKLLEADRDRLAPAERFQLALLYNQVGDRGGVRQIMTELLRANTESRLYLAFYATWLIEQKEFREAEPRVTKLAELEPDAVPTAELRVRVLAGLNNKAGARAELAKLAGRPNPPLGTLAALAEEVGLIPEAEGYFKKLVEANREKSPEVVVLMAGFLARQNRPAEALAVCEAALKTARKVVVCQAAVEVLITVAEPSAEQLAKVGGWVEEARRAATAANEQAEFARQLAYVRNLQGKFDDAIDLYRGLAAGDRPDPSVLNNLAYLISAHRQRHDEALALLAQAKRTAGPLPDLLDTEATVLTARGTKDDLKAARNLLKQALDGNPNAVAQFHLAQLEEKIGDKLAASAAWREAVRLKLKRTDLHPLEWPAFRAMEAANR